MEHSDRDPEALAAELDSPIMAQDRADWAKGIL